MRVRMKNTQSVKKEISIMSRNKDRLFLSIEDIQKEYLPVSKKKIRSLVKEYLPIKKIGSRIYVNRADLENILMNPDREKLK